MTGNPTPKRPFSDDWLKSYSKEHLYYEIGSLLNTWVFSRVKLDIERSEKDKRMIIDNWKTEVFALHLRNIIQFLFPVPETIRKTDVIAEDFCDKGQWGSRRLPKDLKKAKKRADKEVAHLTNMRITGTPRSKNWDMSKLLAQVVKDLSDFVNKALPSRLHEDVKKLVLDFCKQRDH